MCTRYYYIHNFFSHSKYFRIKSLLFIFLHTCTVTYVSPELKLKGCDPDINEKFRLHSNDDVAGFSIETLGQRYFSITSKVLGSAIY